jgi:hypothetical protein
MLKAMLCASIVLSSASFCSSVALSFNIIVRIMAK